MRKVRAGADPDAATRLVTLPADWEDSAAAALAQLAPGRAEVSLAQAASRWILALQRDDVQSGDVQAGGTAGADLAGRLATMLLHRIAAPNQAVWQGSRVAAPAFALNLAAFARPGCAFDVNGFAAAVGAVSDALRLLARAGGRSGRILLGNLDACLAALGLDYDSDQARDVAACLLALATTSAHPDRVPVHGAGQRPPGRCVIPMLARRANAAWQQAAAHASDCTTPELFPEAGHIETGLSTPGPADALLGFEACGVAPIFSPLRPDGRLATSTLARIAARGMSPEAALAASLAGEIVLRTADFASVQAMHRAVSPFIDRMSVPIASHQPAAVADSISGDDRTAAVRPARRELPLRHGGFTQKASVGGHRLYLRTGEYADGSLGEVAISPIREGPAQRGLMEAFAQAVSLGLQHGVPLEAYVEVFAYTRFGPNGAVEGDASISSATSLVDYAFRTLAHAYLGQTLPDAPLHAEATQIPLDVSAEAWLPLDLPRAGDAELRPGIKPGVRQRHGLRLVG